MNELRTPEPNRKYYLRNREVCHARTREWRRKNPDYSKEWYAKNGDAIRAKNRERSHTPEYKIRNMAKQRVLRALRSGKLSKPSTCSKCNQDGHIEGHHPDYSKPLEIRWLCKGCHVEVHYHIKNT